MNRSSIVCVAALVLAACTQSAGDEDSAGKLEAASTTATVYNFGTLAHPGSCLDASGSGTADGTQIQEWGCNGTGAQAYAVLDQGDGTVNLLNTNANKCVDVYGAGTGNGNKIDLWDCNGTAAQKFVLQPAANGRVNIVNPHSNKCLDVAADNPNNGTLVQLYQCNGTSAQLWNPAAIGTVTTSGGGSSSGGGSGSSCNPNAWVYMGNNANACNGNLGEPCGWTSTNGGQGYTCQTTSFGTGCEPGGSVCAGQSGSGSGSGGTGIASILGESMFDSMFPNRNAIYSYAGLVQAAGVYPAFATTGSSDAQKREVAAFLANVAHETGGLVYVDEIAQDVYCQPTAGCPCAPGQEYFGRGALQLSWNYNYCAAGAALGQNLQANPGLVATEPALAWGTGVWFWMTSTGSAGTTCHNGINSVGFGETIQVINGGLECNGSNTSEMEDRVQYYLDYCSKLGVSPGSNTTC